jgi:hypothetical protein
MGLPCANAAAAGAIRNIAAATSRSKGPISAVYARGGIDERREIKMNVLHALASEFKGIWTRELDRQISFTIKRSFGQLAFASARNDRSMSFSSHGVMRHVIAARS